MLINKPSLIVTLSAALLASLFLTSCGSTIPYKPSVLPSLLAFSSDRDKTVHVYTCNPDGSEVKSTNADVQTFDGLPWWSPDGTRLIFTSSQSDDYEVWSMNADGSDRRKLTETKGWDGLARYSPDGSKIVFAVERHDAAADLYYEIFAMNSNGTEALQLTDTRTWEQHEGHDDPGHGHAHGKILWNSVPTWSPDGLKILFSTNRGGEGTSPILHTMNPDGSNQQKFGFPLSIDGTEPDWSPVTNKIVFTRGSAAKGEIWVMDAGSPLPTLTAKKILADIDNNRSPAWSPDGKQIVFVSDKYGNDDIFVMDADGNNIKRITYEKANDRHPAWR